MAKNTSAARTVGTVLRGRLIDGEELTLGELCRSCSLHAEAVVAMVEEGLVEPAGRRAHYRQWRFSRVDLRRIQTAQRLQRDLGVNLSGAALALELLDELVALRERLRRLQPPRG